MSTIITIQMDINLAVEKHTYYSICAYFPILMTYDVVSLVDFGISVSIIAHVIFYKFMRKFILGIIFPEIISFYLEE